MFLLRKRYARFLRGNTETLTVIALQYDIKTWPQNFLIRCAKLIADEVRPMLKNKQKPPLKPKDSVEKPLPLMNDVPDSANVKQQDNLVVISAHPQQRALVENVRTVLMEEGFTV